MDGKFHLAEGISLDGLARVRFTPNGRIDFLSVDESARLEANMMPNMIAQSDEEWFQELLKEKTSPEQKSDPMSGKQQNKEST
jgi:hypothetical protein